MLSQASGFVSGILQAVQGRKNRKFAQDQARVQRNTAYDMAQNALKWTAQDAKAAGINPIYAVGGNAAMPAPVSIRQEGMEAPASGIGVMAGAIKDAIKDVNEVRKTRAETQRVNALTLREMYDLERDQRFGLTKAGGVLKVLLQAGVKSWEDLEKWTGETINSLKQRYKKLGKYLDERMPIKPKRD